MGETARLHSDLEALVGSTIHDRYEVESLLGAGGMGAVFKAHHTGLKRGVAIKVLHPEIGRDEAVSKRFDREAHSASRLDHPNCVRVTDFGTTDSGTKYLVMELLEGGDLDRQLGCPWSADQAIATIEQVLLGLEHAHHVGIVHRDLKPENIFLSKDFRGDEIVKIVDFGIAKLLDERGSEKLTRQGIVFGTPRYMSPEQAAGGKIDARTDLYAVGLILYELLAGRPPFETDDPAQLLRMQIMAPPPPLPGNVPPPLAKVVETLLEKSKNDRYASAREVIDALEQVEATLAAVPVSQTVEIQAVPEASLAGLDSPDSPEIAVASSGSAWQPAPASPGASISGATVQACAADLSASASMSVAAQAGLGQPASASFASLETGAHRSLAASHGAWSQPGMSVAALAAPQARSSPRWLPFVLAGGMLLLVLAGVGMLASSLGDDESDASTDAGAGLSNEPAGEVDGAAVGAAIDDPTERPSSAAAEPAAQPIAPGPTRRDTPSRSTPARPSSDAKSGDASTDSKPESNTDAAGSADETPSKPVHDQVHDQAKDPAKDPTTDPEGGGLDPRQAEREREAAAELEKRREEAEKRAAELADQAKGKGKGKHKHKHKDKGAEKGRSEPQ